jgi:hypothetical protein
VKFVRIAAAGLVVALAGTTVYFASIARRPHLQARLYIKATPAGFPELWKTCPDLAYVSAEGEADYRLFAGWNSKEGWSTVLLRKDGAARQFEQSRDASKVLREACRAIAEDFAAWLSTERQRFSAGTQGQTSPAVLDPVRRYELKEYRHGGIVGLALVDTELGRTWVMSDLVDAKGKKIRTHFQEVGADDLWETDEEAFERMEKARGQYERALWSGQLTELTRVKEWTRPKAIQEAEEKAHEQLTKGDSK